MIQKWNALHAYDVLSDFAGNPFGAVLSYKRRPVQLLSEPSPAVHSTTRLPTATGQHDLEPDIPAAVQSRFSYKCVHCWTTCCTSPCDTDSWLQTNTEDDSQQHPTRYVRRCSYPPSPLYDLPGLLRSTPWGLLTAGAKVKIFGNGQPIGETTAGSEPFLDLPLNAIEDLGPTPTLTVQQEVCGVTQVSAGVQFGQPEAAITQSPALELYDVTACAMAVYVNVRLFPATYLRRLHIIDAGTGVPVSRTIQLIGSVVFAEVSLLQPASARQQLQAVMDTCSATYLSANLAVSRTDSLCQGCKVIAK